MYSHRKKGLFLSRIHLERNIQIILRLEVYNKLIQLLLLKLGTNYLPHSIFFWVFFLMCPLTERGLTMTNPPPYGQNTWFQKGIWHSKYHKRLRLCPSQAFVLQKKAGRMRADKALLQFFNLSSVKQVRSEAPFPPPQFLNGNSRILSQPFSLYDHDLQCCYSDLCTEQLISLALSQLRWRKYKYIYISCLVHKCKWHSIAYFIKPYREQVHF